MRSTACANQLGPRKRFGTAFVLAALFLTGISSIQPCMGSVRITGRCFKVHDGDTISMVSSGTEYRIRLEGIDCPELAQEFSRRATSFTASLVLGKMIEARPLETDRYGRIVARVFVNGKDLSIELLKAGLAWHFKKYSKDPILAELENTARSQHIGLWSIPNRVAPWDYRASVKATNIKP